MPALMIEHALDREMGLAGIGRSEDRDEARCGTEHRHDRGIGSERPAGQEAIDQENRRCDTVGPLAGLARCVTEFLPLFDVSVLDLS